MASSPCHGVQTPAANGTAALPDISKACTSRWIGVEPEPLRFTIENLVPEGCVTLLVAAGGAGKTLLMQTAALCIPTGTPFLDIPTASGTAACVFAEDPEAVLQHRHARICEACEIDGDALIDKAFVQSYFGLPALLWRKGRPTPFMAELESQLAKIEGLRYLALDNNALLYAGNEVDRMEVTAFMNVLNGMPHAFASGSYSRRMKASPRTAQHYARPAVRPPGSTPPDRSCAWRLATIPTRPR